MEGLIPFIIKAVKRHNKLNYNAYRSLSDASNRSYRLINGGESLEGSSHRRTRSEFQHTGGESLEGSSHRRTQSEFHPTTFDFAGKPSGASPRQMSSYQVYLELGRIRRLSPPLGLPWRSQQSSISDQAFHDNYAAQPQYLESVHLFNHDHLSPHDFFRNECCFVFPPGLPAGVVTCHYG